MRALKMSLGVPAQLWPVEWDHARERSRVAHCFSRTFFETKKIEI